MDYAVINEAGAISGFRTYNPALQDDQIGKLTNGKPEMRPLVIQDVTIDPARQKRVGPTYDVQDAQVVKQFAAVDLTAQEIYLNDLAVAVAKRDSSMPVDPAKTEMFARALLKIIERLDLLVDPNDPRTIWAPDAERAQLKAYIAVCDAIPLPTPPESVA